MDDQKFGANLDYTLLCFFSYIIKVNHFFVLFYYIATFNFLIHTRSLLVPYTYASTESINCILLSSFLISSVKTLYFSLLNLCCDINISLLFIMGSLLFL